MNANATGVVVLMVLIALVTFGWMEMVGPDQATVSPDQPAASGATRSGK